MQAIRKILVPVDFSESSRVALEHALGWAAPFAAKVDVLHVWQAPAFIPTANLPDAVSADTTLVELVKKNAEAALERFVAEVRERGLGVREALSEPGSPAHTIVEVAKQGRYDLIVLATHGHTGLAHALIGSVAERVVRHASCPVLTVRVPR
ncbi:MAG TPA: universal stress protein [Polyangiaceae bacterium]|nr:universal stress protein [Polyangiaceae bacterium]